MRKGFKETLATVAIAMLGFNAMAMAPVVGDIPDIIVGDAEDTTGNNVFVFPDALNLDNYVSDDTTPADEIIWSFSVTDNTDPSTFIYTLNGVEPLDPVTDDVVDPGSFRIDNQDNDGYHGVSHGPRRVTVRNENLSPLASAEGPDGPYPGDHPIGVLTDETRTVTLHASDGATVGTGSFVIYTESGDFDSFSPRTEGEVVYSADFRDGLPGNWTFVQNLGSVTQTQNATDGICLEVPVGGDNDATLTSDYPLVPLVQNSVWETRLTVTSNTSQGTTPLWSVVYDNFGDGDAEDTYGGNIFVYDNEGGANSPVDGVGRNEFRFYMMPTSMQAPHFADETDGFFKPGLDGRRDMRVIIRMMDFGEAATYSTGNDGGTICFGDIEILRHDIDSMVEQEDVFTVTDFADGEVGTPTADSFYIDDLGGETNIDFSGGNATLSSNGNAWDSGTVTLFRPGEAGTFEPDDASWNQRFYPVPWEENVLYYIEYELSAPTTDDENNPPNVLRLGADTRTSEVVADHFLIPQPDFGHTVPERSYVTPRTGTPQKYSTFFYSHSPTQSGGFAGEAQRLRPRLEILGSDVINPLGRTTMTGAVRVHSVTVKKVQF